MTPTLNASRTRRGADQHFEDDLHNSAGRLSLDEEDKQGGEEENEFFLHAVSE